MKGKKYSLDFKNGMIEYYKGKSEATVEQAQEHAKTLGSDISKNMHNELRREAKGPAEAPKECVMDLKTGRFFQKLDNAKGGARVAIYELKRRGRIQVSVIED